MNIPTYAEILTLLSRKPKDLSSRTVWCPAKCSRTTPMIQKNLSLVHASKRCKFCKRGFYYIRSDTREAISFRHKLWMMEKGLSGKATLAETVPVTSVQRPPAKSGAERTANYREKKRLAKLMEDTVPGTVL